MPYAKLAYWLTLAATAALYVLGVFPESGLPLLVLALLAFEAVFAELGLYPYEGRWNVKSSRACFAMTIFVVVVTNAVLRGPVPGWFPTPHTDWIFLPLLGWGILAMFRGVRVRGRGPRWFWQALWRTPPPEGDKPKP